MNGLLAQLLKSPRLIDFQAEIERTLRIKRATRRHFRDLAEQEYRAEFINGEVVETMPDRAAHMVVLDFVATFITSYIRLRSLGTVRREQALAAFPRNNNCPDLCFWPASQQIGSDPNQFIFPPPTFVIEVISPSTEARDRGVKFEDYEAHGVKEYWIVDPETRTIEQYIERGGQYERIFCGSTGAIASVAIDGFQMPAEAAFDDAAQMQALQKMLRG